MGARYELAPNYELKEKKSPISANRVPAIIDDYVINVKMVRAAGTNYGRRTRWNSFKVTRACDNAKFLVTELFSPEIDGRGLDVVKLIVTVLLILAGVSIRIPHYAARWGKKEKRVSVGMIHARFLGNSYRVTRCDGVPHFACTRVQWG